MLGCQIQESVEQNIQAERMFWKENPTVLNVKNVSACEMNFTKEEALGRVFRGDSARTQIYFYIVKCTLL